MDENQKKRRVPPHQAEAERAILGAILKDTTAISTVLEKVEDLDFYIPANREIFMAMTDLHAEGKPVDEVTVVEYLDSRNMLREAGGVSYITDLRRALPALVNLPYYLQIVKEKSTLRKLITACEEIAGEAYSSDEEAERVLALAEKKIFDITMQNVSRGLTAIGPVVTNSYLAIADNVGDSGITGLPTGFVDLDQKLSGLQKSDLIVIAGRPAMGKTSFAINIAQHAAIKEKAVVAIFSLEMSIQQLATRMLCTQAKVDMQRIKSGQVQEEDWAQLAAAMEPLARSQLFIDDTAGITLAEMRSKLRRLKMEIGKLDLIVIDYLQLMTYRGKADNRQQEIADTTRQLKIMARDLDVPILLLSQLSRAPEQRSDHRPLMSDLRESGSIEQDADLVILLYRAGVYDEDAGNVAQAIVAKHRNGPTGDVDLYWRGEFTAFENIANDDLNAPF